MEKTRLTNEDQINIFKNDLKESERLFAVGKYTEAYKMLNHASKSIVINVCEVEK